MPRAAYGLVSENPLTLDYLWVDVLYPYVKNTQVFTCPSVPDWVCVPPGTLPATTNRGAYGANYAYRGYGNEAGPINAYSNIRLADIPAPAETILVADLSSRNRFLHSLHCDTDSNCPSIFAGSSGIVELASRHNGGMNAAFVDGHVKWLSKAQALQTNATTGRFRLWTRSED
jgi:prepilin-type processing-associated H-X9-DG protein